MYYLTACHYLHAGTKKILNIFLYRQINLFCKPLTLSLPTFVAVKKKSQPPPAFWSFSQTFHHPQNTLSYEYLNIQHIKKTEPLLLTLSLPMIKMSGFQCFYCYTVGGAIMHLLEESEQGFFFFFFKLRICSFFLYIAC